MFKKFVIAAGLFAALGSNGAMAGGSSTIPVGGGTLSVSATVQASCSLTPTVSVAFGTLSIVPGTVAGTPGAIAVTCDLGTDYAVGLGIGGNHAATRRMSGSGTNVLPYELYTDGTFNTVFQDVAVGNPTGTSALAGTVGATGNGATQTYTVFAKIPATAVKPAPGFYTDSVTVSLVY